MALSPGTTLGPYQVTAKIGQGDTRLDRTAAIKVLPEHVASDPDLQQRFEREAKTISSLNHPHICTLLVHSGRNGHGQRLLDAMQTAGAGPHMRT